MSPSNWKQIIAYLDQTFDIKSASLISIVRPISYHTEEEVGQTLRQKGKKSNKIKYPYLRSWYIEKEQQD